MRLRARGASFTSGGDGTPGPGHCASTKSSKRCFAKNDTRGGPDEGCGCDCNVRVVAVGAALAVRVSGGAAIAVSGRGAGVRGVGVGAAGVRGVGVGAAGVRGVGVTIVVRSCRCSAPVGVAIVVSCGTAATGCLPRKCMVTESDTSMPLASDSVYYPRRRRSREAINRDNSMIIIIS